MNIESQYSLLLRSALLKPVTEDRTKVGTKRLFAVQLRHNLSEGFPLLTKKQVSFYTVANELFWFLRGETNTKTLKEKGISIWDEWADANGNLGRIYGVQWRGWRAGANNPPHDQIEQVIKSIKENPYSRRHIVSAWNVSELSEMNLPPCHFAFQFFVEGNTLNCSVFQRSGDLFLGVPYNIASYALLTHIIADVCGLVAGELVLNITDAHIYANHTEQVNDYLARASHPLPKLLMKHIQDHSLRTLLFRDFAVENYVHSGRIEAPIAI
jgi:thymidylate synthase